MTKGLLFSGSFLALCGFAITVAAQSPAPAAFKPVSSVDALMHGQQIQLKTINELVNNKAAKDRGKNLAEAAELLAELANVNSYNNEKADYQAWARDLRDTSLAFSKDAKKTDAKDEDLKKTVERMKTICQACHDVYK